MQRDDTTLSRRGFVQASAAAGVAAAAAAAGPTAAAQSRSADQLPREAVILFQGDSITDAGRSRRDTAPNSPGALGHGYPMLLAGALLSEYAAARPRVFNRGISGNKVPDLLARWREDCLELRPNVVSILIGVNDIWHKLNGQYDGTVEDYDREYRELIKRTREALPEARIVVCEPFVLRCGAVNDRWFPEFDQRREVAAQVAASNQLTFVPFQSMFDRAVEEAPPEYWAGDGVHPTLAGHARMAATWREATGL